MENKNNFEKTLSGEKILGLVKEYPMLRMDNSIFINVPTANGTKQMNLKGTDFNDYLYKLCYDKYKRFPSNIAVKHVVSYLSSSAATKNIPTGHWRISWLPNKTIAVDLSNGRYVKIGKWGWSVVNDDLNVFIKSANQIPQQEPVPEEADINLLRKFVNLSDEDWFLFVPYLVSLFIPGIQYPLLVLNGSHGTGKSTIAKITKSIADATTEELESAESTINNLAVSIYSKHYTVLDNISYIDKKKADFISQVVTGVSYVNRKFYDNLATISMNMRKPLCINGIGDFIRKSDLADRSLFIQIAVIAEKNKRSASELWNEFLECKPQIMAAIFDLVSIYLEVSDKVKRRTPVTRFLDFEHVGRIVASAMGGKENDFIKTLKQNKQRQLEITSNNNIVVPVINSFMHDNRDEDFFWKGTMGELYVELKYFIEHDFRHQEYDMSMFPKNAVHLGRKLRELKSALAHKGINCEFYENSSKYSCVKLSYIENDEE